MFGKKIKCGCGFENDKGALACGKCGAELNPRELQMEGNAVKLRDDELAASVDIEDLEGFFVKSPMVVLPGQKALIYQENKFLGIMGEGQIPLETLLGQINNLSRHRPARFIIVRELGTPVFFSFEDLLSKEHLALSVELSIGVRIVDPTLFASLMSGCKVFTTGRLAQMLGPRVKQTLREYLRGQSIRELNADPGLRQTLSQQLTQALGKWLESRGLALGEVQTLAVGHTRYDANQQRLGECWLDVDSKRQELEHRKSLDELYSEEELRKIEREETEYQLREKRIELLEKILAADSREAALKQGAKEELKNLEQKAQENKLRREDERMGWALTRQLARIERETELEKARMEQQRSLEADRRQQAYENERLELLQQIELARISEDESKRKSLARLEQELDELELEHKREEMQLQHELDQQQKRRQAQIEDDDLRRQKILLDTKAKLEAEGLIFNFQREIQEWEDGRKANQMEKLLAAQQETIDRIYRHKIEMRAQERLDKEMDTRLAIEKLEAEKRMEIAMAQALKGMSAEELVAASDLEKGQAIVQVVKSTAHIQMSPEQILSESAADSPHAAAALKSHYENRDTSDLSEREREISDKRLQDKEKELDRLQEMAQASQQAQQDMVDKVLKTVETVVRDSRGSSAQPVIVTPGAQAVQPGPEKVLICPACKAENRYGSAYCHNCDKPLG